MRSDPSDSGGLFVGRRPGTAPVHFRALPKRGGALRQRIDGSLAGILLALMTFICLLCWGPIPVACLWIGSHVDYITGSVSLGILVSFIGLFSLLFGALYLLRRLDQAWILVRRAAGYDQRSGVLGRDLRDHRDLLRGSVPAVVPGHPRTRHRPRLQGRRVSAVQATPARDVRSRAARSQLGGAGAWACSTTTASSKG